MPGALANLSYALKLTTAKDDVGHKLMLKMCKPVKPRKNEPQNVLTWFDPPGALERLIAYCKTDVEVERLIYNTLSKLSDEEQELWTIDQRINDRGVGIDLPSVHNLLELSISETDRLNSELRQVTSGAVKKVGQNAEIIKWLAACGCAIPDATKGTIAAALKRDVSPAARRVLEIRQEANKASTKKLKPMLIGSGVNGRARGLLEYHGAGTGRWAGRRVQPQNMPRTPDDFDVEAAENVFSWGRIKGGELG
ncbi:MAG: hypothetical protein ABL897_08090, partial [Hyphomicrobium sp.]